MGTPIQTPIPGQLLRDEFGLRGRVDLQLGGEIVPVVNIADLARGAGLPLQRYVTGRFSAAAVVGEYFVMQVAVPPNTIVQLDKLHIWANAQGSIKIHIGNALAATPATALTIRFADSRLLVPDFINPSVFPTFDTAAADLAGNYEGYYRIAVASSPLDLDLSHIILGSNDAVSYSFFELSFSTANAAVNGTFTWKEFVSG